MRASAEDMQAKGYLFFLCLIYCTLLEPNGSRDADAPLGLYSMTIILLNIQLRRPDRLRRLSTTELRIIKCVPGSD